MTTPLRALILTPTAFPEVTGNAITVERWRRSLSREGAMVDVMETQNLDARGLLTCLDHLQPHLIHAHHVSRAGAMMLDPLVAGRYGDLPLVVSPAGTDISLYALRGAERENIGRVCRLARSIIVQSRETARLLRLFLPDLEGRIACAPKAFLWYGDNAFDLRTVAGCRNGDCFFFMPAGIRPVKGNLECLLALEKVRHIHPNIRAVFAGPVLEPVYSARFAEEIKRLDSFASWIDRIPPQAMRSACGSADVIVNHSVSEGLSNSLLEAMAAGRPILASDIPGNRWVADHDEGTGPCGCLFNPVDPGDFVRKALRLARDPSLRESLAAEGRRRAAGWPGPADEARALLRIYEAAIAFG